MASPFEALPPRIGEFHPLSRVRTALYEIAERRREKAIQLEEQRREDAIRRAQQKREEELQKEQAAAAKRAEARRAAIQRNVDQSGIVEDLSVALQSTPLKMPVWPVVDFSDSFVHRIIVEAVDGENNATDPIVRVSTGIFQEPIIEMREGNGGWERVEKHPAFDHSFKMPDTSDPQIRRRVIQMEKIRFALRPFEIQTGVV